MYALCWGESSGNCCHLSGRPVAVMREEAQGWLEPTSSFLFVELKSKNVAIVPDAVFTFFNNFCSVGTALYQLRPLLMRKASRA